MKQQLSNLDNYEGNIDSLANRISYVRTWSYVSNKSNWVENSDYWKAKTKDIEDKLSEKLHEELSKSFVDKRISILSKGLKQDIELKTKILEDNKIFINDHYIGKIQGLKIDLDYSQTNLETDIKSLKKAARNGAQMELKKRIDIIISNTESLVLQNDFKIYWAEEKIAEIKPGKNYLNPNIRILCDDTLSESDGKRLKESISAWIHKKKRNDLSDLISIENPELTNSFSRGLSYQLFENNGVLERDKIQNLLRDMSKEERFQLRKKGVKIGNYHVYQPRMIRPNAVKLKSILWRCFNNQDDMEYPNFGLNFIKNFKNKNKNFLRICGFETFGKFIIRVDILEKLFLEILSKSKNFEFILDAKILNLLGCNKADFMEFIKLLNYRLIDDKDSLKFKYLRKKQKIERVKKNNSAFSVLDKLKV